MASIRNASNVQVVSILGNASADTNVEVIKGVSGSRIWITKITISVGSAGANNVRVHEEDAAVAGNTIEGGQFAANGGVANPYMHAIPLTAGKGLQVDYSTANSTDLIVHYVVENN